MTSRAAILARYMPSVYVTDDCVQLQLAIAYSGESFPTREVRDIWLETGYARIWGLYPPHLDRYPLQSILHKYVDSLTELETLLLVTSTRQ